MRAVIGGTVSEVKERSYSTDQGRQTVLDVYIGEGRFFDKVSMPTSMRPEVGEVVTYVANIKAKSVVGKRDGERYTFLDVWCVERVEAPKLTAVA